MSSRPSPTHLDLAGIEGDYVVRGWTRPRMAALIATLLISAVVLLEGLLLHEQVVLGLAIVGLVLTLVSSWRMQRQAVTTTISTEGITIDRGAGPRGRTHVAWADAREVYVAGDWQAHSSVRTSASQEVSLPGLDRARARRLAEALRARR